MPETVPYDVAEAWSTPLVWRVDPVHRYWLTTEFRDHCIYLRFNTGFPDEPLYSLLIGFEETLDFDDLPPPWHVEGSYEWPSRGVAHDSFGGR